MCHFDLREKSYSERRINTKQLRFLPLVEMTLIKATFYLPSKKKEA